MVLANEAYPSECIRFGGLVDPNSLYLQLEGAPSKLKIPVTEVHTPKEGHQETVPMRSNEKRKAIEEGPERSELSLGSKYRSLEDISTTDPAKGLDTNFKDECDGPTERLKDALDGLIHEVQRVKYLVCRIK